MNNRRAHLAELREFSDFIIKNSIEIERNFKTIQLHIDYYNNEVKTRGETTIAALDENSRSAEEKASITEMLNDIYAMYRPLKNFSTGPIQICKDLQKSAMAIKKYSSTNNEKNLNNHDVNIPNMKKRFDSVRKLQDVFNEKYETFYSAMAPVYVKIRRIHHTTTNGAADKLAINEITRLEQLASMPKNNGNNEKTNAGGTRRRKHHTKRSKRSRRNKY
jgi:hypothetical protein